MLEMLLKLLPKEWFKETEATGDLIENKITDKTKRVSKTSPQNNLETNKEEILKEYISPEPRQKYINDIRLKQDW